MTGADLFAALTSGGRTTPALLTGDGEAVTYAGLPRRTDAWCRLLAHPRKALVLCLAGRDLATALCYLAALRLGHAVAMLDAGVAPAARDRILAAYRPDFVAWCPGDGRVPDLPGYRNVGEADRACVWAQATAGPAAELHDDLALVLSTSGSTGSPKGVRLSYGNLASNAAAIAASLRISEADRAATSLPLHFSYGLSVLTSHLSVGGSVVVLPQRPTGRAFWRRFAETGCTGFAGVAPMYEMLQPMLPELDRVPTLRVMTSSGSRLRPALAVHLSDYLRARGGRLHLMYGQTEATSRISCLDPAELPERAGSVGTAVPGVRLEIRTGGDIVHSGPNVMLGYAESRADLALGDVTGGVFDTGDLGHLDGDFLYLTGRRNRITKVLGLRLSLDDVERLFEDAGAVTTVAAIDGGDRTVLLVTDGPVEPLQRARRSVAAQLGMPVSLFEVRQVPRLPRLPNGKLDHRALTERAAVQRAEAGASR